MTFITSNDVQEWEFVDADGVSHPFDVANGIVPGRSANTGVPPTRRTGLRIPGVPGSLTQHRDYADKTWGLQVTFVGALRNAVSVEEALAEWASAFNVYKGAGLMRRTRADGVTVRRQAVDYDGGLEIDQSSGLWRKGAQQAVLMFFAADPFWYDDVETVVPFEAATGLPFFPIPNPTTGSFITLTASEVFGSVTVNNDGDVPVWPTWTITGPGEQIVVRNVTTGEVLDFGASTGLVLAAGEVATVVTTPGQTSLLLDDGTNLAGWLTDDSALWAIQRGSNVLQVEMTNVTADSSVELAYRRGWLTP